MIEIKCVPQIWYMTIGSMSASGSAGPGLDLRRGSKFSTLGLGGVEMYTF